MPVSLHSLRRTRERQDGPSHRGEYREYPKLGRENGGGGTEAVRSAPMRRWGERRRSAAMRRRGERRRSAAMRRRGERRPYDQRPCAGGGNGGRTISGPCAGGGNGGGTISAHAPAGGTEAVRSAPMRRRGERRRSAAMRRRGERRRSAPMRRRGERRPTFTLPVESGVTAAQAAIVVDAFFMKASV